ncbi:hypothetical protein BpHYR1_054236 [Brachionus plicatilis]|uniref:Uncharacterized protein n=1 Tax=Brachionus plicatilis TaxID=10195 RepID=A0A3M7SRW7_BRAPC|nr:hypothetical protein BpHYR1_054236 [Brachionus plicatilis]
MQSGFRSCLSNSLRRFDLNSFDKKSIFAKKVKTSNKNCSVLSFKIYLLNAQNHKLVNLLNGVTCLVLQILEKEKKLKVVKILMYARRNSLQNAALKPKSRNIEKHVFSAASIPETTKKLKLRKISKNYNTKELQNKLREKFSDNLNETMAFYRKKDFEKYLEIK